jgi:Tfp pilus assembly protein PilP
MNSKLWTAILLALAAFGAAPAAAQETARPGLRAAPPSYDPAGRRDPFKDLLGGQAVKESHAPGDPAGLTVEEIQIIGVIKSKGGYRALIAVTDGFPLTAREGDRFADGYILSIRDGEVIFRKTRERGLPLSRPKDIVRDITSEER